mmetsp:Transcript_4150/g.6120  ORF Transcript_4150/g.6120 Transcript_4150/m.6120 type:complete len:189 (+) Transcript_4150:202-768(+)
MKVFNCSKQMNKIKKKMKDIEVEFGEKLKEGLSAVFFGKNVTHFISSGKLTLRMNKETETTIIGDENKNELRNKNIDNQDHNEDENVEENSNRMMDDFNSQKQHEADKIKENSNRMIDETNYMEMDQIKKNDDKISADEKREEKINCGIPMMEVVEFEKLIDIMSHMEEENEKEKKSLKNASGEDLGF